MVKWSDRCRQGALGLLVALSLMGTACLAPEEERKGFEGEYCAGSDELCQEGLLCRNSQCTPANPQVTTACEAICERFVGGCGRLERNCPDGDSAQCCRKACVATIAEWRQEAIESFKDCSVTTLTCDQAKGDDAATICYNNLPPLDEQKQLVCQRLQSRARALGNGATVVDAVGEECRIVGRTAPEAVWGKVAACDDMTSSNQAFAACLNESLQGLTLKRITVSAGSSMQPIPGDGAEPASP